MDISLTLAFTIIICMTISCFTVIMWQMIKYLIKQNTMQQIAQSSNIKLNKQHNLSKIKSFMHPVWIYEETTTTANNSTDVDNESVKNESADNKSIKNESTDNKFIKNESTKNEFVDNKSVDNKSAKK